LKDPSFEKVSLGSQDKFMARRVDFSRTFGIDDDSNTALPELLSVALVGLALIRRVLLA
jgi:hypothetical protein